MVKTRGQKVEEEKVVVPLGTKRAKLNGSTKKPSSKKSKKVEEQEQIPPIIQLNSENEEEILELDDEVDTNSELAIGQPVSPNFLFERLLKLKIQTIRNFFSSNYVGLDPRFNVDGTNAEKLRGLILLKIARFTKDLIKNKEFCTYRDLFYQVKGSSKKFETHISKLELQFRPNVRLIEKILKVPRYSLPYYGRPNGFLALGQNVNLSIGGQTIQDNSNCFRLPFGPYNVDGLGDFESNAKLVVIVESHGELRNMISGGILTKAKNTIILTGCGMPDLSFRAVVSKLAIDLKIPVKFIVDCDLHGFLIGAQLAFGSYSSSFPEFYKFLTPEIAPIGILPQNILESDKYFSDLTTSEDSAVNVLRNKWRAHGLELTENQTFWEDICLGFEEKGKKLSLVQARMNRGRFFNVDQVFDAERKETESNQN